MNWSLIVVGVICAVIGFAFGANCNPKVKKVVSDKKEKIKKEDKNEV